MSHVFGPVPSRRLGRSLGIDPVPLKTCNWNCVYCQLGRTPLLARGRAAHVSVDIVLRDLEEVLASKGLDAIDWISFVGSGEPTLNSDLGRMIEAVKARAHLPVAVITNGTLLFLPEVRAALRSADAVMPTVSAGTEAVYRRLHRAVAGLDFDSFIDGIVELRAEYAGKIWPEVMLVRDINDTDEELAALAAVMERIEPDEIQITAPNRPPTEPWVLPAREETIERAALLLGRIAPVVAPSQAPPAADGEVHLTVADTIVETVSRHPMTREELIGALSGHDAPTIDGALRELEESGRAQVTVRHGQRFWTAAGARY